MTVIYEGEYPQKISCTTLFDVFVWRFIVFRDTFPYAVFYGWIYE